jgi:hypothetical protein
LLVGALVFARLVYRVSGIGADGLVYFKDGNRKCGWPSSLRLAGPEEDPALYPKIRPLDDRQTVVASLVSKYPGR